MLHQPQIALLRTVCVVQQIIMEPKMLDTTTVYADPGMGTLCTNNDKNVTKARVSRKSYAREILISPKDNMKWTKFH